MGLRPLKGPRLITKANPVLADAALTAITVLTEETLPPSFMEHLSPGHLVRGLGTVIHMAVGRYSIAVGMPMNEAAPLLFNDIYREAEEVQLAALKEAFSIMGAVWRNEPEAARGIGTTESNMRALWLLGAILMAAESEHLSLTMDDLAADYREQAVRLMVGA